MEDYPMKEVKLYIRVLLSTILGIIIFQQSEAQTQDSLELYTPYTKVTVSPGSTVNYKIDVINNGSATRNENITVSNIQRSWTRSLTSGGYNINKLAILPGEKKTLDLKVEVPFQVRKGNYTFYAKAGENVNLPLVINVSSAGSN